MAEILAEQVLEREHYPPNEGYSLRHNVDLQDQNGGPLQEIDHVVVKDSDVVGFDQTKNSDASSALDKAESQTAQTKRLLRNPDKIGSIVAGDGTRIELSRFDLDNIDDNDIFTVAADSKFDVVNFNEREVEAIAETFDRVT